MNQRTTSDEKRHTHQWSRGWRDINGKFGRQCECGDQR